MAVNPQIALEVAKIRAEVERQGQSCVGPRQLAVLRTETTTAARLRRVAEIAAWEHWSFEFLPDDRVLFRPRPAGNGED